MGGFNKIVPEIVDSSVWNECSDTRVVWVTIIAIKDGSGYVRGDVRTLARRANVSVEACEAALACFLAPDKTSHTPDFEGRRIQPANGGWMVINHDKYREVGMSEATKEYWRDKKRRERASKSDDVRDIVRDKSRTVKETYDYVSASDSEGRGTGEGETANQKALLIESLALEAAKCYGGSIHTAPSGVVRNVAELFNVGHTTEEMRLVFKWVKTQEKQFKPKPMNLVDPDNFSGYLDKAKTMGAGSELPPARKPDWMT